MKNNKLHNIKSSGFKTPDNYFESFEDRLQERLNDSEVINVKSPGFTLPNNYFETFENKLVDKLKKENDKPVITLVPKRKLYYIAGIAASLALLLSLIFNTQNEFSIDSIDTIALENFLDQEDYTNEELASLFKANEISETDFINVNISDDILNQFLENIDTEDLIIE
jgi:Zn-finger domain-containing protein